MPSTGLTDCSYLLLVLQTNLKHFARSRIATRRRFQDFVFLRENLARDFPACVVAPLPDKHRLGEHLTTQ
jgi:sorting nexin-4